MQDQAGMETPINLCNHAYWNLSGDFADMTIENHTLQLEANRVLEFDKYQIPTGVIQDVKDTVFDFTTESRIGDQERLTGAIDGGGKPGIDHAFLVNEANPNLKDKMYEVATLFSPKSGIKMEVTSTQPAIVVYTTNWVAPSETIHRPHAAICLETC